MVFVHGVRSSSRMWDAFTSVIAGDEELSRVTAEPVPRFGYATGLWRSSLKPLTVIPSVSTAADSLKEYLATEAGAFERLMLVGHSQGGLVIQRCLVRMLAEGRGLELARIRRVVLLATPNTGSQFVLSIRRTLMRGNPQEAGLRPFDELVADTLRVVQRDVIHAPATPTERSCRIPFSVYAGESDAVVTRASAQAVFPDAAVLPGDHFTIAKPNSPTHRTYATIRRLLMDAATEGDPDPPADADTLITLGPARLEVHNAADSTAAQSDRVPELTAYLPRAHDQRLRTGVGEALAGGLSRLVMLTGESSTGKTRALYEALLELAPHAPLLHPVDAKELLGMLEAGRIRPGCVLWLNEAQRFFYGPYSQDAAGRLRATLSSTGGIVAVGTLWNKPYWNELTHSDGPTGTHDQAKALLTQPAVTVRIDVPAHLSSEDVEGWRRVAESTGDRRLRLALDAGADDGRVVQHLSGGPELLAAYLAGEHGGPLFTAGEHALITAALDARRLGHRGPLPAALLAAAADGDLPPRYRSPDPDWAEHALTALAAGRRKDGSRTDVRNTLTALTAVYTRSGTPAAYEPADYLDQQTRRLRADRYGTASLWAALIEHACDRDDQDRLAQAAWDRGLRTTAVQLWHRAVAAGCATTALFKLGRILDPDSEAAIFAAAHVELTDPNEVARVLRALLEGGARPALEPLFARDPATGVGSADPDAVARLLRLLWQIGAERAAWTLADRAATDADLTDPDAVAGLLQALLEGGAEQAASRLADRAATEADIGINEFQPHAAARLLRVIKESGAEQAASRLAGRAATDADVTDPGAVAAWLDALRDTGEHLLFQALADRAATEADLTDPFVVTGLLHLLRRYGAEQAVTMLLARGPASIPYAAEPETIARLLEASWAAGDEEGVEALVALSAGADLSDSDAVVRLLRALWEVGAEQAVSNLAASAVSATMSRPATAAVVLRGLREIGAVHTALELARQVAADADLTDTRAVCALLSEMRKPGAEQALAALLERDPVARVDLTDEGDVFGLYMELRRAGAETAAAALIARVATDPRRIDPQTAASLLAVLREAGESRHYAALAVRAVTDVESANLSAPKLLRELREAGERQLFTALAVRLATDADVTNPWVVARLLREMRGPEAQLAIATLVERDPAAHIELTRLDEVVRLLQELRKAGQDEQHAALASRAVTDLEVSDPIAVGDLLQELREAGQEQQFAALAARAPADADVTDGKAVHQLWWGLWQLGAEQAAAALSTRAADAGQHPDRHGRFGYQRDPFTDEAKDRFAPYGREPDGRPSAPWTWHELIERMPS